ncbi:MAG: hypothetical protein C5B54_05240 [Acidobacteria bacterium]|nr:MAG: hypothetical protein C5B54_05240 [Acidobacteriota bacterium]
MNVAYFSKYSDSGPSSRFRIYQFREALQRAGISVSIQPFFDERYFQLLRRPPGLDRTLQKFSYVWSCFTERQRTLFGISSDLIVIEHQLFPYLPFMLETALLPAKYVLEFDDAIYLTHPRKIPHLIRNAYGVITGNKYLEQYARHFNDRVFTIPTVLDTDIFRPRQEKKLSVKIRVGWSGLEYNFKYLRMLEPVLNRISEHYPVEVLILSGSPPKNLNFPFRFLQWSKEDEVNQLQQFDIGIMPLESDEWCRGKCGFKLLQYLSLEIPSIATAIGVNVDIVKDGFNSFTATNSQEWEEKLSILIQDSQLRRRMGEAGRQTVLEHYSLKSWAPRLAELYRSLAD